MSIRLSALLLLIAPTASFSESEPPAELLAFAERDFTALSRSEFVDVHKEALRIYWEPSMLIFSRIDNSLAQLVPPFIWNDDFADAYGCLYDDLKGKSALEVANTTFTNLHKSVEYIFAHPDFSMLTVDQHEVVFSELQPSETYNTAMMSCGLLDLNAQLLKESGLFDAYIAFSLQ